MESFLKTVAKEATKRFLSFIYAAVKDIVRQVANHGAADNVISSRSDRLTESHGFVQSIIGCVVKTWKFTSSCTNLSNFMLKLSVKNGVELYEQCTIVERKNQKQHRYRH